LKEKKMTDEMSLTVFDPLKAELAALDEKDSSLVFDHKTPEGEKNLRSYVRKLRGYKGDIGRIKDDAKREAITFGRKIQAIHNELIDGVQKIIDSRMKPLDEIEEAKRAEAEAIVEAERLANEKAEADRIAEIERREAEVAAGLAKIKAAKDAEDAKWAEAERKLHEKKIADDAADKATKDAENKARVEAAQVESDRLEEIENEKAVARMDAEVERKRVADKAHREKIQKDTYRFLCGILSQADASMVMTPLVDGNIPHVKIVY
jgi:hypothetical protein